MTGVTRFVLMVLIVVLVALAMLFRRREDARTGPRLAALVAVAGVLLLFVVPILLAAD